MASRLAVAEKLMKQFPIKDINRFRLGCILPDAYNSAFSKSDSHLKILVCGKSKKTYDLDGYLLKFIDKMDDELYRYFLPKNQSLIENSTTN